MNNKELCNTFQIKHSNIELCTTLVTEHYIKEPCNTLLNKHRHRELCNAWVTQHCKIEFSNTFNSNQNLERTEKTDIVSPSIRKMLEICQKSEYGSETRYNSHINIKLILGSKKSNLKKTPNEMFLRQIQKVHILSIWRLESWKSS